MTVPPLQPELTRENRYTDGMRLQVAQVPTFLPVVKCRSCGSIVQDTDADKDKHERLHPRVRCEQVPNCFVWHEEGHAWEEQFQ